MSKIEVLNKLLTKSAEKLVECCSILRDEPVNPEKKIIYKFGKAIYEINEIREQIYNSHPEIKPEKWGKPTTKEDIEEMYQTACQMSLEHLESGNIQKAIKMWESYIYIGQPTHYEQLAEN